MKKNLILVVDVRNWAFDNIAQYLKAILKDNYNCHVMYASDYKNYQEFFDKLGIYNNIDFMHFFYRAYLSELLEMVAKNMDLLENSYLENFLKIAITTNVPEHLFIDNVNEIADKITVFSFIDNYYTVTERLNKIYHGIRYYPKPWGTIYDNILANYKSPEIKVHNGDLVITWVGNSKWGDWHYGKDYDSKGFKTLVLPIFAELIKENISVKENILDSQSKKRTKEEIFAHLQNTDILLMCAKTEGTPLPIIEAMASGCAIISTDAGIFPEISPQIQQQFIVKNDPKAFVEAIKKLNLDRLLLAEIKRENFLTYQKVFCDSKKFVGLWSQLIEDSIIRSQNKDRSAKKLSVLKSNKEANQRSFTFDAKKVAKNIIRNNSIIRSTILYLLKIDLVRNLVRNILSVLDFFNAKNCNIRILQNLIASFHTSSENNKGNEEDICVIYPTMFPGVANSTKTLFSNALPLHLKRWHHYLGISDKDITQIAEAILKSSIKKLIFSSGEDMQIKLVRKLHNIKADKKIDIYLLWHGSPAQWVDYHHRSTFYKWLDLYKEGKIRFFITLKKDLEKVLIAHNVASQLLQNFISVKNRACDEQTKPENFRIGVWSASNIWIKNLYPQLLAVSMLKEKVECYTNFKFQKQDRWMTKNSNIKIFAEKLPNEKLLDLIAETSLTLYVTNSECSPMIALESLGLGIPCLVGPTSDLYNRDEYLREMLTVNRVDCPFTIFIAIEKIMLNYEHIKSRIPSFVTEYNNAALKLKNLLIERMRDI
ncbi:MAG: glycosyltransferase [Janthinobacterium lividum]